MRRRAAISLFFAFLPAVAAADFLDEVRGAKHTGIVFKSDEISMEVGRQYKMKDIVRSGLKPAGDIVIRTPPCNMKYNAWAHGESYKNLMAGDKDADAWGMSSPQGPTDSELANSYVIFTDGKCNEEPWLYADGQQFGIDKIKIKLTGLILPAPKDRAKRDCAAIPDAVSDANMDNVAAAVKKCKDALSGI